MKMIRSTAAAALVAVTSMSALGAEAKNIICDDLGVAHVVALMWSGDRATLAEKPLNPGFGCRISTEGFTFVSDKPVITVAMSGRPTAATDISTEFPVSVHQVPQGFVVMAQPPQAISAESWGVEVE